MAIFVIRALLAVQDLLQLRWQLWLSSVSREALARKDFLSHKHHSHAWLKRAGFFGDFAVANNVHFVRGITTKNYTKKQVEVMRLLKSSTSVISN